MDLIEDEPRKHPQPVPFFQGSLLQPTVPEVSLILQDKFNEHLDKKNDSFSGPEFQTYNAWRWKHLSSKDANDIDTKAMNKSQDFRLIRDKYASSDIEKRKNEILYGQLDEPRRPLPPRPEPVIPRCTESFFGSFEKLNLVDDDITETNTQKYKPHCVQNKITIPCKNKTEAIEKDIDKSNKLYNIIFEQNKQTEVLQKQIEQLLKLQEVKDKQIEQLLKSQEVKEKKIQQLLLSLSKKDKEVEQLLKLKDRQESQLQELIKSNSEKQNENFNLLRKLGEIQKREVCTVGTMTYFQVIDASTNTNLENFKTCCHQKEESIAEENISCIRDSSETNGCDGKDKSLSLHLSDLPPIPEHVPTPQSSIHVDIQDFHDSSDENDSDGGTLNNNFPSTTETYSNHLGYTFYNNVLSQVKDIIQNSGEKEGMKNKDVMEYSNEMYTEPLTECNFVTNGKGAVQSFQAWGVLEKENNPIIGAIPVMRDYTESHFGPPNLGNKDSPSDISLKINALALKYLKKDQISQYDIPNQISNPCQGDVTIYNVTNLSFGSMRYLDRYKILPKTKDQPVINTQKDNEFSPAKMLQRKKKMAVQENFMPTENVLDISTLNKQPKLL